ncbi:MAG: AMP-binding protein, partial [Proteobacteria bacterium]|nr:AMP-binding protein [Pseudomonadota bacterium]
MKVTDTNESRPLSYGQRSQWFLYRLAPDSGGYNINSSWHIKTKIDVILLRESLKKISNRHPIIRTTYHDENGLPYQLIDQNSDLAFQEIDGSKWDKKQISEFIKQETYKPFVLEKDSKLRWNLVKISDSEYVFTGSTPHIASDLWSHMIIMNELKELYLSAICKAESRLPHIQKKYDDFVNWQLNYASSVDGERDWEYWLKKLEGELPILDLPYDHAKSSTISFSSDSISLDINNDLFLSIKKVARKLRVTPNVFLLAIYQLFLHRYTGQADILVGTPTAGRNRKDYGGIVGYFVNMIPIRARFIDNPSFRQFLDQVRQEVKDAREHQDIPFSLIVERLQPKREMNQPPIIQTLFGWEDSNSFENMIDPIITCEANGREVWDMGDFSMELIQKKMLNEYDLSVRIGVFKECLRVFFDFNPDVFEKTTIKRMIAGFQALIESVVENPDVLIEEATILSENEKNKILYDWNNTETDYPRDSCVHHLFESIAEKFPDSIALEFDNAQMTYKELNDKANQLANYLLRADVKPGNLIGICLDRSLDMIIGIMGIIKAGGAYVPIDSALPDDRIDYMINDAKVSIIITQENYSNLFLGYKATVFCIDSHWNDVKHESKNNLSVVVKAENLFYVMYTSGSTG